MKKGWILFGLALVIAFVSACAPQPTELALQAQETARALQKLHNSIPICHYKLGNPCHDLNPIDYFVILPRLSIHTGYALDYVNLKGPDNGPVMYVHAASQPAFMNIDEFRQAREEGKLLPGEVVEYIEVEDTPEGYLDLAIFHKLNGQFNLIWHGQYFDIRVVATPERLEEILALRAYVNFPHTLGEKLIPDDVAAEARWLDLNPTVTMGEKEVTVSLILFTKWGGFFRQTLRFDRAYPHKVVEEPPEFLVEFNCGWKF